MTRLLVLVHTVPPLLSVFDRLSAETLPGVKCMHILDEPLLERVRQRGRLLPEDSERLLAHVTLAQQVGADAVLVTCSTISPCVDNVRPQVQIPVIKIDEAMIEQAVMTGARIGVVATSATALEPTRHMLQLQAERVGKTVTVQLVMVEGALPALLAGDGATHDRLVRAAVLGLMPQVDVVLLAQASMARVLDVLPSPQGAPRSEDCAVPVLSSPHLALALTKRLLGLA